MPLILDGTSFLLEFYEIMNYIVKVYEIQIFNSK
jgi:hypothetical protein